MLNHDSLVPDGTENVDTTTTEENVGTQETVTEPAPKTYSQEEVNEIVKRRNARTEAKIRKEYEEKYGDLESVLKAGTGQNDVAEMTSAFRDYYESKGIQIPVRQEFSDHDIEVLARAEAEDIIKAGYDDVVEEVDRLANIGLENMRPREKKLFETLAEHRVNAETGRELSKIGVTEDVYTSKEFREFSKKFSSATPPREIYEIYSKMQPKKEVQTMGSMKSSTQAETGVKDFYSYEEAVKFSKEDFDRNPALYKAVQKSMLKW